MAINFFIALILISSSNAAIQTVNGKIKVTVGTTSGSENAVNFIADLASVYEDYKQFLEIEFVPWGRSRFENGKLVCEYGAHDCWANRLHRCVLNMLKGNEEAQMRYMACEFTVPLPAFTQGTYTCAHSGGLNLIDVDFCMSTTGNALERPAAEASIKPMEVINSVPFIVINDNIDLSIHEQAIIRLRSLICFALANDPSTGVRQCRI